MHNGAPGIQYVREDDRNIFLLRFRRNPSSPKHGPQTGVSQEMLHGSNNAQSRPGRHGRRCWGCRYSRNSWDDFHGNAQRTAFKKKKKKEEEKGGGGSAACADTGADGGIGIGAGPGASGIGDNAGGNDTVGDNAGDCAGDKAGDNAGANAGDAIADDSGAIASSAGDHHDNTGANAGDAVVDDGTSRPSGAGDHHTHRPFNGEGENGERGHPSNHSPGLDKSEDPDFGRRNRIGGRRPGWI